MKNYNFETTLKFLKDALMKYLKDSNIYYELSDAAPAWHFEIKTTPEDAQKINNYIDSILIIYSDKIMEG